MNIGSTVVLVTDYIPETIAFFKRHGVPIPQKNTEYEVASVLPMANKHPFSIGIVLREYAEYKLCFNIEDWREVSKPELMSFEMEEAMY